MICDRAVWLNNGQIIDSGDPVALCQEYSAFMVGEEITKGAEITDTKTKFIPQQDTGMAKFIEFELHNNSDTKAVYYIGDEIPIKFSIMALQPLEPIIFGLSIYRADGDWLVSQVSSYANVVWPSALAGEVRTGIFMLDPNCLCPGEYRAALAAYPEDLSLCYALTEIVVEFSVRSTFPTWAKFLHPCRWIQI